MVKKSEPTKSAPKFAGIEVPPELNKRNFFFLFFNTFVAGLLMSVFGILQPAFLKDVIKINQDFAGSINAEKSLSCLPERQPLRQRSR